MTTFTRGSVTFRYPTTWALEADDDGPGWTVSVSVSSEGTAFLVASLRPDADHPAELADGALDALKAEYPELDADPVVEGIGGQPAVGYDADFLAVDTTSVCLIRAVNTPDGPLLLLAQMSDYDREANEPLLRAVLASIHIEDE